MCGDGLTVRELLFPSSNQLNKRRRGRGAHESRWRNTSWPTIGECLLFVLLDRRGGRCRWVRRARHETAEVAFCCCCCYRCPFGIERVASTVPQLHEQNHRRSLLVRRQVLEAYTYAGGNGLGTSSSPAHEQLSSLGWYRATPTRFSSFEAQSLDGIAVLLFCSVKSRLTE